MLVWVILKGLVKEPCFEGTKNQKKFFYKKNGRYVLEIAFECSECI
jgi:hypothetical protein